MSTENVRRLVPNVTRQLGAPVAAQRAQGLGLTNHFHEPLLHQPLAHEPPSGVDSPEGASDRLADGITVSVGCSRLCRMCAVGRGL